MTWLSIFAFWFAWFDQKIKYDYYFSFIHLNLDIINMCVFIFSVNCICVCMCMWLIISLRFLFFIMCSSCRFLAADSWQFAWWLNGRQLWPLPESIFFLDDFCWLSLCYHYVPTRFNLHLYFWFCSSSSFSDCLVAKTKQKQKTTHTQKKLKSQQENIAVNVSDMQSLII